MNFTNVSDRNEAAAKIFRVSTVETTSIRKLQPKIVVCNVNSEESKATDEEMIRELVHRND